EGRGQIQISNGSGKSELTDSLTIKTKEDVKKAIEESPELTTFWPFQTEDNLTLFVEYKDNFELTDTQLYDSMQTASFSDFDKIALKQAIRVSRAKSKELTSYAIEQMPFMMFIMLPVFALLLKLLYVRRKQNYIIHLVHSLHIHSFRFLLVGLATLIAIFTADDISLKLIAGALILSEIYIFLSFKKVYNQSILKTFAKVLLFSFTYMILFSIGLVFEFFISAAFY
ncbi:MAG: hypothetical protein AAFO69_17175, partial [Bacteroidota bacterium]